MPRTIRARYEAGVLKPRKSLELKVGGRIKDFEEKRG